MAVEAATEKKLYDAATKGDLPTFQQLLQGDPYLLDVVSFAGSRNLLHIATIWGQATIVEEVLRIHPELARTMDSQNSTALHIAAAKGNFEITEKLLKAAPEMRWFRDCQGMNPIHVAAMNGHSLVLEELIHCSHSAAREKLDRGETVFHLCVKNGHLHALKVLVRTLRIGLVGVGDDDGDTILHLAARYEQYEILQYLAENNIIKKSRMNSNGETALDILEKLPRDKEKSKMEDIVRTWSLRGPSKFLDRFREIGMVITVLIATMAFQAIVSPPGGVWQDDSSTHRASTAIMAHTHPKIYKQFIHANTIAFVSSLITIFMLTTEYSSIHVLVTWAVMQTMWVSMAAIAVSYGASVMSITPYTKTQSLAHVIWAVVAFYLGITGLFRGRYFYQKWKNSRASRRRTGDLICRCL